MSKDDLTVEFNDLKALYVEQLWTLHAAQTQLLEALPGMAAAATMPSLQQGLFTHLAETHLQVTRLEAILTELDETQGGQSCKAMQSLVAESRDVMYKRAVPVLRDAGLISVAQRMAQYEMAGYGMLATYARALGLTSQGEALRATEREEKLMYETLTIFLEYIHVIHVLAV